MAQFDVHRNLGRHHERIPFVVVVQSTLYDEYRRRVVAPLVSKASLGKVANPRFNPTFRIKGQSVVLHPLEIVSVATQDLGELVASLEEHSEAVIGALDELLTRWR
ncbi:MAG TPA: CcdB family protein [Steroidobacteraceae bacterium]